MNEVAIARALHVLAIVLWVGGVGFVTTVLLPAVLRLEAPKQRREIEMAVQSGKPRRRACIRDGD